MAADFKSHVLLRDEKGFMGIPFKRLLLAGVSGGMAYTLVRLALPGSALGAGLVLALAVLILTGTRGGLPLWQRLLLGVRGRLLLAAAYHPESVFGMLARALDLPLELVRLDAGQLYGVGDLTAETGVHEWVTYAHAFRARPQDGLVLVERPLEDAHE